MTLSKDRVVKKVVNRSRECGQHGKSGQCIVNIKKVANMNSHEYLDVTHV